MATMPTDIPGTELLHERPGMELVLSTVKWHPRGLEIPEDASERELVQLFGSLYTMQQGGPWYWGDAINAAESILGEKYAQLIPEQANRNPHTLTGYAWCAAIFEISRRRETLSYSHHSVVAKLHRDDQERFLDRAEAEGWSEKQLREAVRAWRNPGIQTDVEEEARKADEAEDGPDGERSELELLREEVELLRGQVEADGRMIVELTEELEILKAEGDPEGKIDELYKQLQDEKRSRADMDRLRVEAAKDAERAGKTIGKIMRHHGAKSTAELLRNLGIKA